MPALFTYGYLIQGVYIAVLAAQSVLIPWLIGADAFGLGVYLLSIAVISEGLFEPVWQLSITNRPENLAVGERVVLRDSLTLSLAAAAAAFILALQHAPVWLGVAVALHCVLFYLSAIAQSYLYKLQRIRQIAWSMVAGLAAFMLPVLLLEGVAKLLVANLCFVSATLAGNAIALRDVRLLAETGVASGNAGRFRFYLSCLSTRAPFVILNNGLAFVLGAQGLFREVAVFRVVTSAIYAGRFLSPVSPGIFSKLVDNHRLGNGPHPMRVLLWKGALWSAYGLLLVAALPYVIAAIYPGMTIGWEKFVALVTPFYLSMQMLFYWFILRSPARNRDLTAIVISTAALLSGALLYVAFGVWVAFSLGCLLTWALIIGAIYRASSMFGGPPSPAASA